MDSTKASQPEKISSKLPRKQALSCIEELFTELDALNRQKARLTGLNPSLLNLLSFICQDPEKGATTTQAARHLGISPQALTKPVHRLLEMKMIKRGVDKKDGRAKRIIPTALGREKAAKANELTKAAQKNIQEQIPAENVALLDLDRLIKALKRTGREFA